MPVMIEKYAAAIFSTLLRLNSQASKILWLQRWIDLNCRLACVQSVKVTRFIKNMSAAVPRLEDLLFRSEFLRGYINP